MTRILIRGGHVVALGTLGVMTNASIIVEDGIIQSITPSEQSSELGNFDEVLGDESSIVLPGFINCHYHSELAVGPGLYQYIFELANISIQGSAGHLSEQDIYDIVQYGLALAIRGGQTAVLDMFYGRPLLADFGTEAALTAYKDIGMRVAFGLVSRDQNLYVHQDNDEFLAGLPLELADEIRRSPMGYAWPLDRVMSTYRSLVRTWDGHDGRVRIVLAPDWTPACSDDLYRQCRLLADEDGTGIVSHVLETRSEMLWSLK